jgi:hypothetical protein
VDSSFRLAPPPQICCALREITRCIVIFWGKGIEFIHPHDTSHELGPYNDMLTIDTPTIANFADAASFPRHQQTTSFFIRLDQGSGTLWPCLSTCNAVLVCVKKGRFWAGPFVWDLLKGCGAVTERLDHTERKEKKKNIVVP